MFYTNGMKINCLQQFLLLSFLFFGDHISISITGNTLLLKNSTMPHLHFLLLNARFWSLTLFVVSYCLAFLQNVKIHQNTQHLEACWMEVWALGALRGAVLCWRGSLWAPPTGGATLWKISGVTHPSYVNILPSWTWVSCALLWGSRIWRGRGWGFCIALRAAPPAPRSSRSWCSVVFWVKILIIRIWRTKCALLFSESFDGDP